ncbi:MAG: transposase [Actinomadura sp.]
MRRGELTDRAWARLEPLLPAADGRGRRWRNHRQVINGILWRLRTGSPWRDVPERYGRPGELADRCDEDSVIGCRQLRLEDVQEPAPLLLPDSAPELDGDRGVGECTQCVACLGWPGRKIRVSFRTHDHNM